MSSLKVTMKEISDEKLSDLESRTQTFMENLLELKKSRPAECALSKSRTHTELSFTQLSEINKAASRTKRGLKWLSECEGRVVVQPFNRYKIKVFAFLYDIERIYVIGI